LATKAFRKTIGPDRRSKREASIGLALCVKMVTGTYPMGTGHPYPHPPDQNLTRRVTRTRRRVENSFHTRTRRVILTRRVTRTQQYTRVQAHRAISSIKNKLADHK